MSPIVENRKIQCIKSDEGQQFEEEFQKILNKCTHKQYIFLSYGNLSHLYPFIISRNCKEVIFNAHIIKIREGTVKH